MVYYIQKIKRIGRTCKHVDVYLNNIGEVYHQLDMEEAHKDPKVVPTVDPKYWPKTLETVAEYIRGFVGVDEQPLSYGLMYYLEPPAVASDPTYLSDVSWYFTHDKDIIARGLILSGSTVIRRDPEAILPFTNLFITDRFLI